VYFLWNSWKTASQIFNEARILKNVYSKRAALRQKATQLNGRDENGNPSVVANLPPPKEDLITGKNREQLSEATGVPQKKLDTILEI
jgi:hypothetical protein